MMARLVLNS
ncbi:hypothetical protein AAY473_018702 [Plecturocebus cupreus]